jgi:hypothetical protein
VPELDIRGIFKALDREGVEFLVIGGVAVGFHGFVRATKDVDIVPSPEPQNLARLARLLAALDAQIEGAEEFKGEELPDPLDPKVLALGGNWVPSTRLGRFDVMQWIGDGSLWKKSRQRRLRLKSVTWSSSSRATRASSPSRSRRGARKT